MASDCPFSLLYSLLWSPCGGESCGIRNSFSAPSYPFQIHSYHIEVGVHWDFLPLMLEFPPQALLSPCLNTDPTVIFLQVFIVATCFPLKNTSCCLHLCISVRVYCRSVVDGQTELAKSLNLAIHSWIPLSYQQLLSIVRVTSHS